MRYEVVHVTRAREFLTHYADLMSVSPEGGDWPCRPDAAGAPPGEEKQFVMVPDSFLVYLTQRRFSLCGPVNEFPGEHCRGDLAELT